jgi:hypothetical protein
MSATLTWASSGNGTKTGTAVANFFDDLDTLITSKAGDATFYWQKAGKNSAATPYWLLLSRKDASNGRILIVCWTSAPAGNNAAILDTAPTTNQVYIAYFPAGTANTASNLTASSGTICGDDTGAVKVSPSATIANAYAANFVAFYFDSAEAMVFNFANPASAITYIFGAGSILIDASDNVYAGTFGSGSSSSGTWGSSTSSPIPWVAATTLAGSTGAQIRTNYGSSNRAYFFGWQPSSSWANQVTGPNDVLTDTAVSKAWFVPTQLLAQGVKGEGFVLKFRQFGFGPGTTGAFSVYNTTGPVVAARQACNQTAGANGFPWMTNFKL